MKSIVQIILSNRLKSEGSTSLDCGTNLVGLKEGIIYLLCFSLCEARTSLPLK